ncbi:hypothetical protein G6F37_001089 [Rhizopus arrhizus]|nr:hypothetical protein G6F38_004747 [Rhizopus arrhizus]KAG1163556.1 hypothetical protein G6F37_001089 [Rhizopus arrhizus]
MSNFILFRENIVKAIDNCLSSVFEHRENNREIPSTLIESLVNQHILPLTGPDNTLQIPIVEDKPDWRKSATELAFRRALIRLVDGKETEERFKRIFDCCDIVLYCSEIDLLDQVIPLSFTEELFDLHTTEGCEKIFDYVEQRKTRLTANMVPGKGKGLVLLRMCNELLRRLSKEINTVFCGRILMFLANSFPLGERSGVNLRGDFNTNAIHFDTDEEVDADPNLTDEQKAFYKLFWSTRIYFANPPSVFTDNNFEDLQKGTNGIVEKFQSIAQKEAEILGARNKEVTGTKRSRTEYMDEDDSAAEEILNQINNEYQFPRLLSSRRLLDLEMEDARFRRSVIVQYLILFQYLSGFSQEEKERTAALLAARGTTKQSLVQPNYVLSDEQVQWIDETREILVGLLRSIKPHGNLYTDIILTILAHERHWIIWKASGCPSFEKPPMNINDLQKAWRTKRPRLEAPPTKYRYTFGTYEISSLYGKQNMSLSELMINRAKLPSIVDVIDSAVTELQDSLDPPKERFNYANGALLQASRLIHDKYPHLIREVYGAKKDVYKKMYEKMTDATMEDANTPDDAKPVTLANHFVIGENLTEDHVQAEIEVLTKAKQILLEDIESKKGQMITLDSNQRHSFTVSSHWAGRIWARESCDYHDCLIAGASNPASLAEFRLSPVSSDIDYYDLSFVDGYNLPLRIEPLFESKIDHMVQSDERHCRATECTRLPLCPQELQVVDDAGKFIACKSACSKYGLDQYCCTGKYSESQLCKTNRFAREVERVCPDSYSYAFDDDTSIYGCRSNGYNVIFCP